MAEKTSVIEEVLGIDHPDDIDGSLEQAIAVLTGAAMTPEDYVASFNVPWRKQTQLQRERYRDYASTRQLLQNPDDLLSNTSTLTDWTAYCRLMRDFGTKRNGTASALLIGAYSATSARSFERLAKTEYGAGRIVVLDTVAGADKMRHGTFVYGNGTELPFADGSFDFVQTNRLIHKLEDPSSRWRSARGSQPKLLAEIARVTAPDGQVFMEETIAGGRLRSTRYYLKQAAALGDMACETFASTGFASLYYRLGSVTQGGDIAALFNPERPIDSVPGAENAAVLEIYARKLGSSATQTRG